MTTEIKTTTDHIHTASLPMHDHRIRNSASKAGRFTLHFLEMLLAMMVGMPVFFMLRNQIPASSIYAAAFVPGTNLHDVAMFVFMVVPMVVWMIVRGHGWRHSAEMAFSMSVPVVAAIALRLLGVGASRLSLIVLSHLGMLLGMLIAMLYRREHYSGKAHHAVHAAH
jgi:peptidoglycan/LPS O-acetylase OafA/YrhL